MKIKKKYKEMTVDEAVEKLRENGMNPIDGVAAGSGADKDWTCFGNLESVTVGNVVYPFRFTHGSARQAALVAEETQWEIGDCVEVANDNDAPRLQAGAKGIVVDTHGCRPRVRHTSPNSNGNGKWWMVAAADLRPWQPGYGYLPTGERVPDKDGWEMVPEDDVRNDLQTTEDHFLIWSNGESKECDKDPSDEYDLVRNIETGTIRAVYRRKQPALQLREGGYYQRRDGKVVGPMVRNSSHLYKWQYNNETYTDGGLMLSYGTTQHDLIAEVQAPKPQMVPFDGPDDLPEWPVIWVKGRHGILTTITRISSCSVYSGSESLKWKELFEREISPDRRNWQTAGKEVPSE